MKNTFVITFACAALFAAILGCGGMNPLSSKTKPTTPTPAANDKTLTDKTIDTAVGDEKTGVPECDEVSDFFVKEANNPDDGYVAKAIKAVVFSKIKEQFKKSIEENKTDKVQLAKDCKKFLTELQKAKEEQASNSK